MLLDGVHRSELRILLLELQDLFVFGRNLDLLGVDLLLALLSLLLQLLILELRQGPPDLLVGPVGRELASRLHKLHVLLQASVHLVAITERLPELHDLVLLRLQRRGIRGAILRGLFRFDSRKRHVGDAW